MSRTALTGEELENRWVRCLRQNAAAENRLLCIPYAGGTSTSFLAWARALPDYEVYAVELPGHLGRLTEPLLTRIEPVIEALARLVEQLADGGRPLTLCGYSLGGSIAFELVRYLEGRGHTVKQLAVFAAKPPHLPWSDRELFRLPDDDFIEQVQQRYGGIPAVVLQEKELLQRLLPVLRADVEILSRYECQQGASVGCPVAAFGGADDREFPPATIARWADLTTAFFEQHTLEGGHFFVDTNLDEVLARLRAAIAR